jgi:ribosomal subunit interface protein
MEITVHSQHGHLPESLKAQAASKMEVLGKYLSTIDRIDLEVDRDGQSTFLVRAAVATSGPVFRSRVAANDPMEGIDIAVERLSRRLKEFKRRRSGRPLHSKPKEVPLVPEIVGDVSGAGSGADVPGILESEPGTE